MPRFRFYRLISPGGYQQNLAFLTLSGINAAVRKAKVRWPFLRGHVHVQQLPDRPKPCTLPQSGGCAGTPAQRPQAEL